MESDHKSSDVCSGGGLIALTGRDKQCIVGGYPSLVLWS